MAFIIEGNKLRRYEPETEETTVIIPDGIRRICRYCFKEQKQLTSVIIPEGVEAIGQDAFAGCMGLREIRFPASLKEIEMYAFKECTNLERVHFSLPPEQAHIFSSFRDTPWYAAQGDFIIIGDTLYECRKKDAIIRIPDGVRHIHPYVFYHREKLTQMHLPDGLLTIGRDAFSQSKHLCSIYIPDTVQYIGYYAFENTAWLENKTEEFIILGDGILYHCQSQAKMIVLPQEVKRITAWAFHECSGMTGLVTQTPQGNITLYEAGTFFPVDEWERMMEIVHENDPQKQEERFAELKKASCKIPLALYMTKLSERPFFHTYLRRMCKRTMELFITYDDTEAVSQMMQLGLVTSKNVDGFISFANTTGAFESQMLLMHYKHEELGYKKPENAFRL